MPLQASDTGSASPVLGLVLFVVYFIPAIVAILGRHRRWLLITLIDVLFGWTVIGWFIAIALLATRRRAEPVVSQVTPPMASTANSRAEQLERLAALRDRGALTDEEFATEKAKLLGTP
jgi:hypothetical protein